MNGGFGIGFERPAGLLLLLLVPIFWWIAWRRRDAAGRAKTWASLALRTVLVALLAASLAQPRILRQGEALTLALVVDVSRSIPAAARAQVDAWLTQISAAKERPEDRLAVIAVGADADTLAMPDSDAVPSVSAAAPDATATDLSKGVRRALAVLPADTASRVLLISDGNETVGNLMEAADLARANGIPLDVLPVMYDHQEEVVVEGMRIPARVRTGQSVDLKVFIRSQAAARGQIQLLRDDVPVDLDPDSPGSGLPVELNSGANTITIPISMERQGAHRFRAVFEPESGDVLRENNLAAGIILVQGDGRVLLVDDTGEETRSIAEALAAARITTDTVASDKLAEGASFLASYDAIVLANIPRYAIDNETDRLLHAYVHDIGGGLLMLGGDRSFGAGGWIGSEVAATLPVKLEPPQTRELPRGALCLIVHSCEMPNGNYWGEQVAINAINALSSLDYLGIITFDWGAGGGEFNGAAWAFPLQLAGDKTAPIAAAKGMRVGDMPDFEPTLQLALKGLDSVRAGQKHVIVISDGDPGPPLPATLALCRTRKITVTTVMVAGHGTAQDNNNMRAMAEQTGGNFYNVQNPKLLPRIFVKEATLVTRSLILEGEFQPRVASSLPGPVQGFTAVPPVRGYVLTVARDGLAQVPLAVSATADTLDPLYAYWNYGLGKSVAFTSDVSGRWGAAWTSWNGFQPFWERTARWLMRPAPPRDVVMQTRLDGEQGIVDLEAFAADGAFVNFARTQASVIGPDGNSAPLNLEQIGPGRYRGTFSTSEAGAYLVNAQLQGAGTAASGTVQAALSVAYPREFRATRDNRALLEEAAQRTGGRVLSFAAPQLLGLFDREGLAMPESERRIWDLLAMIAAALLVIDVAVRRLAFDREAAREMADRAVGGAAATGAQGLAAWKRAKQSQREAAPAKSVMARAPSQTTVSSAPPPLAAEAEAPSAEPKQSPDAGESDSPMARLRAARDRARRGHGGPTGGDA